MAAAWFGRSFAAIRGCDAGSWFAPRFAEERVPTLEEALVLAAELGLSANIEIKAGRGREYATAAAAAATMRRWAAGLRKCWCRASCCRRWRMRELAPPIPRGVLFRLVPRGWGRWRYRLGCTMVGADHRRLRPGRIAEIAPRAIK